MESYQTQFHRQWGHLRDPHVRALAWLLDAPDLLDPEAPQWNNQIASLGGEAARKEHNWLLRLDQAPGELHACLNLHPMLRLGRYAESLMAFYFRYCGNLVAHGVQVHNTNGGTIGEFDFLLQHDASLLHWEFATKLYLLEPTGTGSAADYFVGPNLTDTLGAKIRKIFERQLSLAQHPAAQLCLPQPVTLAQALVKGWLFYHEDSYSVPRLPGVSENHCRGFWRTLDELDSIPGDHYLVLPRLSWLAPARSTPGETVTKQALRENLIQYFSRDKMPVLVAVMTCAGDAAIETERGFIVPNDWRRRAGLRRTPTGDAKK